MKKNDLCKQNIPHLQYIFLEETLINFKNGCIFNHFCINTTASVLFFLFRMCKHMYLHSTYKYIHMNEWTTTVYVIRKCTLCTKCLTNTRKIFGGKYFYLVCVCSVCMSVYHCHAFLCIVDGHIQCNFPLPHTINPGLKESCDVCVCVRLYYTLVHAPV